jgi:hypothetical protein
MTTESVKPYPEKEIGMAEAHPHKNVQANAPHPKTQSQNLMFAIYQLRTRSEKYKDLSPSTTRW